MRSPKPKIIKPKKCPECKEYFTPYISTLQKLCGPKCAADKARRDTEKDRKAKDKKEIDVLREKNKKHGDYEGELQTQINILCRLIDFSMPCIACDKFGKMAAAHRFNVNDNNTWRFNLHNVHISCYRCNDKKSGNLDGYDEGLQRIYGYDYYEYVKFGMKRNYPIIKLTKEELTEARKITMQIIKELNKVNLIYPMHMRRRMRDEYNSRIGIYTIPYKNETQAQTDQVS